MSSTRESRHGGNILADFHGLLEARSLTPDVAARLASVAADVLLTQHTTSERAVCDAVTLLCELASLNDPALAQIGLHGLFPSLVEPLGDAFTPEACMVYNRLFAQVIQHCRKQPGGEAIDGSLRQFGLVTETDILARATRVREPRRFDHTRPRPVRKAFVLSRVTLGADVAVTSVVLAALKAVFPRAEIRLVANARALQLFAGDPRVQLCAINYPRGGGLIERLMSWQYALEALRRETLGLDPGEYVIVDPDSRLTQLGLLPLVADEHPYLFFESRSYSVSGVQKLSALTAHWLQKTFGMAAPVSPYCAPSPLDVAAAKRLVATLKTPVARPLVSINLGVGTNPAKRLPDPFEFRLLARLLSEGATVILDKGAGVEEVGRIDALVAKLRGAGFQTVGLDAQHDMVSTSVEVGKAPLLTWQGSIGRLAALIAESTAYIGYDSAGQHIAAALGVPTVDIFTGFTSPRLLERWSPCGPAPIHVLAIETAKVYSSARLDAVVDDVLTHIPQG